MPIILLLSFLIAATNSNSDTFNYIDFSSVEGLSFVEDAAVVNNFLRVTPSATSKHGAVWYNTPIDINQGFTSTFQFRISEPGGIVDNDGNNGGNSSK